MKKLTKIFSFLLCIVMVFSLVACGTPKDTNPTETSGHDHESENVIANESGTNVEIDHITTHDYVVEITKEATCIENGSQTFTCECGDSYTEDIVALGHDYTSKTIEATKESHGYTEHICTRCGDVYQDGHVDKLTDGNSSHTHKYTATTKEATCTENGEKIYTCECGESYTEKTKTKGHSFTEEKITATCVERGYTLHTCKTCGYNYKDTYVNALGHTFGAWTSNDNNTHKATCSRCKETKTETHKTTAKVTKDATCTANGEKTYTCNCGYSFKETVQALGHDYKTTTVKPTATEKGYDEHTCSRCKDSYRDNYKPATGPTETGHTHSYTSKVTKEANCTTDGVKTYTCNCGDKYTETIKATGHKYTDTVTKPTCTAQGYTTHTCTKCNYSYKDTYVDAKGHSYKDTITSPTCTTGGYTTHTCNTCGNSYKDNETKATGHSYSSKVTKAATCTANGTKTFTCNKCNDSYTETIKATGHNYLNTVTSPTCTTDGYTTHKCANCGDTYKDSTTKATGHNWSKKSTTKVATCTENGIELWECSRCHNTENRTINATGHTYDNGTVTKKATCTETGVKTYTCTKCNNKKTESIPKTDHDYEAHTEQVPEYGWVETTLLWVYYNTYPVGDARRNNKDYDIHKEWIIVSDDENYEDKYMKAYTEYNNLLKEIQTNGWSKTSAGFGGNGDPVYKIVGYKTVTTYVCKNCGHKK